MDIRTRDEGRYHQREMLIDGQVVAWLTVIDYQMRIGSALVRMAGIGGVETAPQHRMKGLMRILFEDTVRYMTGAGYDVSLLFGIPNFYTKFGYATCLPSYRVTVATRNAELAQADAPACQARPMQPEDLPFVIDLYERHNIERSCSVTRTAEHFTHFPKGTHWGQPAEAVVFEDEAGRRVGYAAWDKTNERVSVIEAEAEEAGCFGALLAEFARQAVAKRCGHITLHLPPDHSFAEYLQRFGCEWTIAYPRHADGMMRLLNQATLFDALRPELERRVMAARLPAPLDVSVITELGALRLRLIGDRLALEHNAGAPASITLSQDKLAQLIAGYRPARDVLNDAGAQVTGNALPLLDALFPRGWPHLWHADHF
jgi:predicted acetyltransferase